MTTANASEWLVRAAKGGPGSSGNGTRATLARAGLRLLEEEENHTN